MAISEEQKEQIRASIKQAEEAIPIAEKEIAEANRAGIDVSVQVERLKEVKARVRKLKSVYGS